MKVFSYNKKISHDYSIQEKYLAGIVLFGYEVKSIKSSNVSITDSFISVTDNEVSIVHMYVPPIMGMDKSFRYNPNRKRRLLLNKYEIKELYKASKAEGLTIVPIKVFLLKNKIKVEIAVVRGLKKYDKRDKEKKLTANKEMEYEINRRNKGKV